jgi:magnesium transporter
VKMSESRFYHISKLGKLTPMDTLAMALAAMEKEGFIWLDFCQPSKEELTSLIKPLNIHPLAIEDCLDENQVPKIEDYPGHTFILINAFHYFDQKVAITEVDLLIGHKFLVTVSGRDAENQPILQGVEHNFELDFENILEGPAFLAHIIMDRIVDQKFVAIEALEERLDQTEDVILTDHPHFLPGDLVLLRRELITLRKSLFHEREVLMKISRKDSPFIPEKAIFYYRDIYDHLVKFFELTESARDLVTSLMEMYLSIINNQMTRVSNETNVAVRRLTVINTIFMPLTLLAGIGGMSEWSMMTGPQNWKIAYPAFLLGMAILGISNFYLLKWWEKKQKDQD